VKDFPTYCKRIASKNNEKLIFFSANKQTQFVKILKVRKSERIARVVRKVKRTCWHGDAADAPCSTTEGMDTTEQLLSMGLQLRHLVV
jgi:hypothetical protein